MGLRKYQKVEKSEVVSPEEARQIEQGLNNLGKTSARELDDEERQRLLPTSDH